MQAGRWEQAVRSESAWVRFILPVLATLWLGELAAPISQLLNSGVSLPRLLAALIGTALFVALYLWVVVDAVNARAAAHRLAARSTLTWLPAALMALLSVLISSIYGLEWLGLFIFSAVAAGLRLPTRQAAWAIVALTAVAGIIGVAKGDSPTDLAQGGLLVAGIGASVATVDYGIRTTRELRAARAEVAHLAVSEERLRFARDLHDLLGHSLSLVALKCDLADQLVDTAPERARHEIQEAASVTRQALRDVREAVAGYRRPTLADELLGAQEMLAAAGIGCRVDGQSPALPPDRESALAWALREGVTNVIRHSRAQRCVISLTDTGDRVELAVADDGRGVQAASLGSSGGNGLAGLKERLATVGGRAEAQPSAGGGFRLAVWVPL